MSQDAGKHEQAVFHALRTVQAHFVKPCTIRAVPGPYARSSAKLLIVSGAASLLGVLLPWVRVVQTVSIPGVPVPSDPIYLGISMAKVTNLSVWISVLSLIPLAVGLIRYLAWKTMPNYIYRIILPLAVADLVLLFIAWHHVASYELLFQAINSNGHAEFGPGLRMVVGSQIGVLVAGANPNLFREKDTFGWFNHYWQFMRRDPRSIFRADN
jgi:hypothetical protein